MTQTIVVLDPMSAAGLERMRAHMPAGFVLETAAGREPEAQLRAMERAGYVITGDMAVTGEMMRRGAANGLKGVHKWGVGYDNIDVETARDLGIRVMRTTGSNARAVAETAVGLMLAVQRSIVAGHEGMRRGEWAKGELGVRTFLMSGKTVGLVGLGFIGSNVARILKGFGCRVLYAKPTRLPPAEEAELGVEHADLDTLLKEADIVSLHCALSPETRGLIGAAAIAAMKDGVVIVNTARGGIVDEAALADAIESGKVRGAGIDVYETEPPPSDLRLLSLPNVVVTPHIAAQAADNYPATVGRMFENIRRLSAAEPLPELDVVV